ncbi:DNA recombination protein RmuC [Patescibacteria group bacterium]|nr:DNA recombination protein RmuC [Patescibacteria group bacterium]
MDQTTLIFILIVIIVVGFIFFYRQLQMLREERSKDKSNDVLMKWLEDSRKGSENMQDRLDKVNKSINDRLDNATKVIGVVSKELGKMSEIGRHMKEIQEFLGSPKLRGGMGEYILRDLLEQMLPKENFKLQYRFRNGQIVDAIVKIEKGIIPIDSKFPMENFRRINSAKTESERDRARKEFGRDVKKHIEDISQKYVLPDEGTIEIALMYIPSEPVYYEVLNSPEIIDFATEKRVWPSSPHTIRYVLTLIIFGLEGRKMEEKTREIYALLRGLRGDSDKFNRSLSTLTKHITDAKNTSDLVNTQFASLRGKIDIAKSLQTSTKKSSLPDPERVELEEHE